MNQRLRDILIHKTAADGTIEIENETPESVSQAPKETPTEGKASPELPTEATGETEQTKFITDAVEQMLCQQIGNELFAFYEYKAVGAWATSQGWDGFAAWGNAQACGELTHMQKILDFLVQLGCTPELPKISGIAARFDSMEKAVEGVLKRERAVTKNWRIIAKECLATFDSATLELAQWFVTEQMEEEDVAKTLLAKLAAAGTGAGILVLDGQLLAQYGG